MNNRIEVKTQAELNAAIKAGDIAVCVSGSFTLCGNSTAILCDNSTATLCGNSTATLCGNSTAILCDNSTATLYGNSTATLYGNSTATAFGNVFLRVFSCLKISAGIHVVIMDHGDNKAKINGGKIINAFKPKTALQWCRHWGVQVVRKIAILFKGVDEKYMSARGGNYTPATIPVAPDWDGGEAECGGGLHFSPYPVLTHEFCSPKKYVACPVALKDIVVHPTGLYTQKVKARGCCAPVWEVNKDGEKI